MTGRDDETSKTPAPSPSDMLTPTEIEALRGKELENHARTAFASSAKPANLLSDAEIVALRKKANEDADFALAAFGAAAVKKVVDDDEPRS